MQTEHVDILMPVTYYLLLSRKKMKRNFDKLCNWNLISKNAGTILVWESQNWQSANLLALSKHPSFYMNEYDWSNFPHSIKECDNYLCSETFRFITLSTIKATFHRKLASQIQEHRDFSDRESIPVKKEIEIYLTLCSLTHPKE